MENFNAPNFEESLSNSTSPSESAFEYQPSLIQQQTFLPAEKRISAEKKLRKPRGKKLFSDERVRKLELLLEIAFLTPWQV
jgi:hypothetical protein